MPQHKHREAFCHMQYFGKSKAGMISLTIWNSRDGVTPFMTFCREFGIEMQHVNWSQDRYEPSYKPKKGDLIWRDVTKDEIIQFSHTQFDCIETDYKALEGLTDEEIEIKYRYNAREHMRGIVEAGRDKWAELRLQEMQPGEPHLELVKEDWK